MTPTQRLESIATRHGCRRVRDWGDTHYRGHRQPNAYRCLSNEFPRLLDWLAPGLQDGWFRSVGDPSPIAKMNDWLRDTRDWPDHLVAFAASDDACYSFDYSLKGVVMIAYDGEPMWDDFVEWVDGMSAHMVEWWTDMAASGRPFQKREPRIRRRGRRG